MNDNEKSPASPQHISTSKSGFTKVERASIMIASELVGKYTLKEPGDQKIIAKLSVELAREILEEANK